MNMKKGSFPLAPPTQALIPTSHKDRQIKRKAPASPQPQERAEQTEMGTRERLKIAKISFKKF
jgi:hypothetical protein